MTRRASIEDFISRASFWKPDYLALSRWFEHAPFAFWLVDALRPTRFVELGTHWGFSYQCFCEAVTRLEIPSEGFAVDTWQGDEQTGFYGEEVFTELVAYHDPRYSAFSRLVQSTFDDAVGHFDDGSIDLLHIDGLHTYEVVGHDFATWHAKLSPRGVVLFHDTNVRERGFGVHRLWAELRGENPGFEFLHGHGLGVLGVGKDLPQQVRQLLEADADPDLTAQIRQVYARLGTAIRLEFELGDAQRLAELERSELASRVEEREAKVAALEEKVGQLKERVAQREDEVASREHELSVLLSSESWRLTAPLRFAGSRWRRLATRTQRPSGLHSGVGRAGRANPRQRLVVIAKRVLPVPMQRYVRQRFPGVVEVVAGPSAQRSILPTPETSPGRRSRLRLAGGRGRRRWLDSAATTAAERDGSYIPPVGLLPWFDPLNLRVSQVLAGTPRLNVLLPGLAMRHMSGGPNTAIVFALQLARDGIPVRFFSTDAPPDPQQARFWRHARDLIGGERLPPGLELVSAYDRSRPVKIGENDVFLATAWWTAQQAKYAVKLTRQPTFLYLIQDFEPLFMPASSGYALAVETYSLNHVPIINTSLLHEFLIEHRIGRFVDPAHATSALVFEPALDRTLFHPPKTPHSKTPRRLLLYARPTNGLRNLFELGVAALQSAIVDGVLDPVQWEFWGIGGETFSRADLGGGARLSPAPWRDLASYASLLRESDVLLSCMLSPHPSYPPLEMAASGGLVVTTEYENKTADRLALWSRNIIGVPPTIDALRDGLAEATRRLDDLDARRSGADIALPQSWNEALAPVMSPTLERLALMQGAPPPPSSPSLPRTSRIAPGFRRWPRNPLEVYRRSALERRRAEYWPRPEPEFLSFLTPVWNTDQHFLETLAESILGQDTDKIGFEWVIIDNGSTRKDTLELLERLSSDQRVRLDRSMMNLGIVGGLRACLERARCRYIATVDHDDLVTPDCLRVIAASLQEAHYPLLAYTDEDKLAREFRDPYLKPAWDPVLFANHAYIAHLGIIDRRRALELGAYTDPEAEGSHDWDTFARFANAGHIPFHIPELLYTWRMHSGSTAANIRSKPVVFESQRKVVHKLLAAAEHPERYEVEPSPLFSGTPDWRIRRTSDVPTPITSVVLGDGKAPVCGVDDRVPHEFVRLDRAGWRESLASLADRCAREGRLIHLIWTDTTVENSEWPWEAMTHFELFPDTAMIGGRIHRRRRILAAGSYFGFGSGCETPDRGRSLDDPGYMVQMWKPHSVSAVSSQHAVIDPSFLRDAVAVLPPDASLPYLGSWLGGIARDKGRRVVYSPFLSASTTLDLADFVTDFERAVFRRAYATIPDERFLSPHLGLSSENAYQPVSRAVRTRDLAACHRVTSYDEWLAVDRAARVLRASPHPVKASGSILTCVYQRSPVDLFEELAHSVLTQTTPIDEWVIVIDGQIPAKLEAAIDRYARDSRVTVVRQPLQSGIIASLRAGLESATSEFVVPVDADDVLAADAWQVLAETLVSSGADYAYSDEDVLRTSGSTSPFMRPDYDPVLNLESPYIWHLSAFSREIALQLGAFTDPAAELSHDYDTSVRFELAGRTFTHAAHVLYHWRRHSSSPSHSGRQNPGSVESVRAVLRRVIETSAKPDRYEIAPFPIHRGAEELYIERLALDPPAIATVALQSGLQAHDAWSGSHLAEELLDDPIRTDASDVAVSLLRTLIESPFEYVLVVDAAATPLGSRLVWEAVKLFELHKNVVIVSGRHLDGHDCVVASGWVLDEWGGFIAPYNGMARTDPGPWAVALKAQSIASPVEGLFLIRQAFLREIVDAVPPDVRWLELGAWLGGCAFAAERRVAYSPLVEARIGQLGTHAEMRDAEKLNWRWRSGARQSANDLVSPILGGAAFVRLERATGRLPG